MKKLSFTLLMVAFLCMAACGNNQNKKAEEAVATETADACCAEEKDACCNEEECAEKCCDEKSCE